MTPTLPLHPGAAVALGRVGMDETQVAQAMMAGDIASPHSFSNIWFFRVRVTGTGVAERPALNEIAIRNPDDYLNPHFLQRCLGLPVVLQHPPGSALTSKEFAERIIGTIVLAWVEGDEIWSVAKIYDQNAAKLMRSTQLSTSPGVVFLDPTVNEHLTLDDGKKVLIEGKPALLDHLAICPAGVWDKGGPAAGVDISGESKMPTTRTDDSEPSALDKILASLTGIAEQQGKTDTALAALSTRFDAMEEKERMDAEAEEEKRQAAELEKLAAEEEAEAEKMEREDRLDRKDDENEDKHSKRCDAMAERCDSKHFRRKDGESEGEHSKRMDAVCAERRDRKDAKKDDKDMDTEMGRGTPREPERSDKARRDAARRDEEEKERMDEKEADAPVEAGERKDSEGDFDYSMRMDSEMRRVGLNHLMRRSGESRLDHVRRLNGFRKRQVARKDALDSKAQAAAALNEAAELRKMLTSLTSRIEDRSDADVSALADAQARADEVFSALGKQAPRPLAGEDLLGYRIRLARMLQEHSPVWKGSDITGIARADSVAFNNAEGMIYDEARKFALSPATVPAGELREVHRNFGGRTVTEFVGDPLAWMGRHMPPRTFVEHLPLTEQTRPGTATRH